MDELEEKLRYTFSLVNEWLRFAEAKNTGLFAFNAALLAGTLKYSSSTNGNGIVFLLVAGIGFLAGALTMNLLSFLPLLSEQYSQKERAFRPTDNPLFFGDCAKYSINDYFRLFNSRLCDPVTPRDRHVDLAKQIITNSKIAVSKYNKFAIAAKLSLVGILTLVFYFFSTL